MCMSFEKKNQNTNNKLHIKAFNHSVTLLRMSLKKKIDYYNLTIYIFRFLTKWSILSWFGVMAIGSEYFGPTSPAATLPYVTSICGIFFQNAGIPNIAFEDFEQLHLPQTICNCSDCKSLDSISLLNCLCNLATFWNFQIF